jgi:cyclic-di-GMP-binding protein
MATHTPMLYIVRASAWSPENVMTQPYPRAELSPPTRIQPPTGSLGRASPGELEAWIDDRSARDPAQAAEVLTQALQAVNGAVLGYRELTALTEVLLARVPPVLGKIELQLRQLPIPLGNRTQTVANAYADLSHELARASLRLVDEGLEQRKIGTQDTAPHLRRALLLLACRSLHFWRLYQPLPPNTWLQIYRVLEVAESLRVAGKPAADAERLSGQNLSPDSVESLVARIAVLSSAGVYALHHGEAGVLARWLESVPVKCMPDMPAGSDESNPLLLLALHEDRPPSLVTGRPSVAADRRLIDLRPVVDAIRSGPAAQGRPGTWHPATGGLDRRLLNLWVVPPTRRFSREPSDAGPIITVTGLNDIHALVRADYRQLRKLEVVELSGLPGSGSPALPSGEPPQIPAALTFGISDPDAPFSLEAPDNGSNSGQDARFLSDQKMDRLSTAWNDAVRGINPRVDGMVEPKAVRMLQPTAAQLRNLGAGGISLLLKSPTQKIYSGDLIAIRTTRKNRVIWQLGVIRWLCYEQPEGVTIGIEYLAPGCTPTDIRPYRSNTAVGNPSPGLFFHPHGKSEAGALFFAPGTFSAGSQVAFRIAGEQRVVRLDTVRPESHTFSRADFRMPAAPAS